MPRRAALLALCAAALGCQDYRFNPVGRCLIQPGQRRIQLEAFTTADILFVVDDSGSMAAVQQNLADNFSQFIDQLAAIQADRKARGLDALDFHIAITTSSVFTKNNTGATCGGSPLTCNISNPQAPAAPYSYACTSQGAACGDLVDHYYQCGATEWPGNGTAYPAGDFVAQAGNAKVLHFTKDLDYTQPGAGTLGSLIAQFKANIKVGDCGSGMEQHFEGSRLAVKKAFQLEGLSQASGVNPGEWGHPGAKMVLVWVGNEDDCSNPKDRLASLIYSGTPGSDVCTTESAKPLASQRLFKVDDYASFFLGLGRPLGAALIYPGTRNADGSFTPGDCSIGFGPGRRFKGLADGLRSGGVSTLEASVCDASFSTTLKEIADLVKPLEALTLPSQPAAGDLVRFRIVDGDRTVKVCAGPDVGQEWWFVDCPVGASGGVATGGTPAGSAPSKCIAIQKGGCEANPGQTYVAEYLGRVPAEGCPVGAGGAGACAAALGGTASAWTCEGATGQQGTCLCSTGN